MVCMSCPKDGGITPKEGTTMDPNKIHKERKAHRKSWRTPRLDWRLAIGEGLHQALEIRMRETAAAVVTRFIHNIPI